MYLAVVQDSTPSVRPQMIVARGASSGLRAFRSVEQFTPTSHSTGGSAMWRFLRSHRDRESPSGSPSSTAMIEVSISGALTLRIYRACGPASFDVNSYYAKLDASVRDDIAEVPPKVIMDRKVPHFSKATCLQLTAGRPRLGGFGGCQVPLPMSRPAAGRGEAAGARDALRNSSGGDVKRHALDGVAM